MKKNEFLEWLPENTAFEKADLFPNPVWRKLVEPANKKFDFIIVNDYSIEYKWERKFRGGHDYTLYESEYEPKSKSFSFDEFVEAHKNNTIKD